MGQKLPPLDSRVGYAATPFIDQSRPPSHDELSRLFAAVGLTQGDPGSGQGKLKRMRAVVDHALMRDRAAGARLVFGVIQKVRAAGGFREDSEHFVGTSTIKGLQEAYRTKGFELTTDGELRPLLLDNVPESERDEVLRDYVARARGGARDAALVTGTGKDLLEAAARRSLARNGLAYAGNDFPGTLFHAFRGAGLPTPPGTLLEHARQRLDSDPRKALVEVLYLLACQVNRLRNEEGTGHGRAFKPSVTDLEARIAVQVMGMTSELLLEDLPQSGSSQRAA